MNRNPGYPHRRPFLAGLLAATCGAAIPGAWAETDAIGVVVSQSGIVTVLRAAEPDTLKPGSAVYRKDRIVTGPDARLRIAFDDGSTVAIGPRTDVTISRFLTDDQGGITHGILDLVRGIMRTTLVPSTAREQFEVRTRTAVASVRSTDWIVEASDRDCAVFVVSGAVGVSTPGTGNAVTLTKDFGTDVADSDPPTAPRRWGKERVARVLRLTEMR